MIRRLLLCLTAIALVSGFITAPPASAQQSVNFFLGGFVPHKDRSDRGVRDVLVNDMDFLDFDLKDFNGVTVGGEYLVGLTDFFDAGLGVGYYSRTSPAIDRDFVHPDGSEVEADLKLRNIPFTATVRFLPLGHHDAITPYIGGGVGINVWRYEESGDFVLANGNIIRGTFTGNDTTVGPVILGGLRIPIGRAGIGFEYRYQGGKGDLPQDQDFAGASGNSPATIDLGGSNWLVTFNVGF